MKTRGLWVVALAIFATPISYAETIIVPVGQQGSNQSLSVPTNGMKRTQVEARWGQPESVIPARGEPAISGAVYSGFTVYFENDVVLHSVIHHKPNQAQ